jgi:hypothetical protein
VTKDVKTTRMRIPGLFMPEPKGVEDLVDDYAMVDAA